LRVGLKPDRLVKVAGCATIIAHCPISVGSIPKRTRIVGIDKDGLIKIRNRALVFTLFAVRNTAIIEGAGMSGIGLDRRL